MDLTTGAKIAIGCGVALIVGIIVVAVGIGGAAYWAKGKVEQFSGNENRIEELQKKANATAFERPADNVIREDRLVKFIDVRKRVYATYEKHQGELEALGKKKQGDFSDLTKGFSVINEIRLAQAEALAAVGMSEDEYHFMVEQVYKSAWANEVAKSSGGKTPSQVAAETYAKAQEAMKQAQQETAKAREQAKQSGQHETAEQAKEAEKSLEEGQEEAGRAGEEAREAATSMDVPPQNLELFRKYEAEIKKYAMGGLEWIGL
jgi:hypothetical protein